MATIYVDNPVTSQFAMIPNALWSLDLPPTAKLLFGFLLSFQDGAAPSVALIEATLKIGKDSRQAAFKALEVAGYAGWSFRGRPNGRGVDREMWVSSVKLVEADRSRLLRRVTRRSAAGSPDGERENPAHGSSPVNAGCLDGERENPAEGQIRDLEPENPPKSAENPAHKVKDKTKTLAREGHGRFVGGSGSSKPGSRSAVTLDQGDSPSRMQPGLPHVSTLSDADRRSLRCGHDFFLLGKLCRFGSRAHSALAAQLRECEATL